MGLRANVLRVFLMYEGEPGGRLGIGNANGLGPFRPQEHPDFYARLPAFAGVLAEFGMRFESVLLADAQDIMPDEAEQQAHCDRVVDALAGSWNASFVQTCNEPFKNGVDVTRVIPTKAPGVLRNSGNYLVENGRIAGVLEYVDVHTERKPDWVRTVRSLSEIRDGAENLEAVNVAVVSGEPTGFAEVERGDSRSTNEDDAAHYAAGCALFGAGATFHSEDGIASRLLGPVQTRCAFAWFDALCWVPVSAQFAPYQRGSRGGGPSVGNMPIEHHDLDEGAEIESLRTFCKVADGFEYCDAIRPGPKWKATPLRGCTVVEEPRRGLVKLREP